MSPLRGLISWGRILPRLGGLILSLLRVSLTFLVLALRYHFKHRRAYRIAMNEFRRAGIDPQTARELAELVSPKLGGLSRWMRLRRSGRCSAC